MTKTEARLALSLRQRRFEWALARDEHARAAARLVARKTHDLQNLLQILRLATGQLEAHCDAGARVILDDLQRTSDDATRALGELMAAARPAAAAPAPGARVGATVTAAVAALQELIDLPIHVRIDAAAASAATRCTAEELEHIVIGLALDAAAGAARAIELEIRERQIAGTPWIELVRGSGEGAAGERFELTVAEAIAQRAGGELATSERADGGEETIVCLPRVR